MSRAFLGLGILLVSACAESAPGGSRLPQPDGTPTAARDSLPVPEPGALEGIRAMTDPGVPGGDTLREEEPESATSLSGDGGEASQPQGEDGAMTPGTFLRPEDVRGIYLNAWTAGSVRRREALMGLARRTEINTFVIDIKDASGYVSHDTQLPLAREVGATGERRIRDLHALMESLRREGIYPIARIVVAKDPILTAGRPDLAIQDSAGGVWLDQDSVAWLNFFSQEVWDYHVDLAREVARAGFPEIQWDYVRFPDAPEALLSRAVFPGSHGQTKAQAVREFLAYARAALDREGVLMTADVFGVTTSYRRDVGIGQLWEAFIDQVDVALPMVYPSHYWPGSFGFQTPNAYPYEIVRRALRDAVTRSRAVEGAGSVRPWLQDFSLGQPPYGAPEVRAQIQAAYDVGITEWILWNPGSRYTEAALIPARGLPSWLEPVMRVGGEVVPVSKRFQVLGEDEPTETLGPEGRVLFPDSALPELRVRPPTARLKAVPLPDTGRVRVPDAAGSPGGQGAGPPLSSRPGG